MSFYKKIFKVMSSGAVSALASYLSTLLVLRYAGLTVYAEYIVDLSVLAVIVIVIELVPSYYIVYKVQEDSSYYKPYATFIWLSIPVIVGITLFLGYLSPIFKNFSPWILLYAIGVNIKRYFDVRYQATGQVQRLYTQESVVNIFRVLLILLYVFVIGKQVDINIVWATIGISQLFVYTYYLTRDDIRSDFFTFQMNNLNVLFPSERKDLGKYYLTTMAKKLRDNILPLSTGYAIHDKEALGIFFFLYRSYAAVAGLLRVLESFLVNRIHLESLKKHSIVHLLILSVLCAFCFLCLIFISVNIFSIKVNWVSATLLSLCFIPYTYTIVLRADAYSKYMTNSILKNFIVYASVIFGGVWFVSILKINYSVGIVLVVIAAEIASLFVMRSRNSA